MPTEFSIESINEYFTKLNPIAEKISLDIDETKSSYEHIWTNLNLNEHNEIINETLIKPEISLRYFDNFSITTTASSLSLSSIGTLNKCDATPNNRITRQPNNHHHYLPTRRFYDFDGRNLSTYSEQKVGLKITQDDILGTFRDAHSMPFSYKTKSQINLKLFLDEEASLPLQQKKTFIAEAIPKPLVNFNEYKRTTPPSEADALKISVTTFKKLQIELASNLSNRNNKIDSVPAENEAYIGQNLKLFNKTDAKYKRFYDESVAAREDGIAHQTSNQEPSLLKLISKNGKSKKYNYNGVGGDVDDEYERVNLMLNCCSNSTGGLTTSSSSAPSEDDEKTLCEDIKSLIENDGLRNGFDFLNNW